MRNIFKYGKLLLQTGCINKYFWIKTNHADIIVVALIAQSTYHYWSPSDKPREVCVDAKM